MTQTIATLKLSRPPQENTPEERTRVERGWVVSVAIPGIGEIYGLGSWGLAMAGVLPMDGIEPTSQYTIQAHSLFISLCDGPVKIAAPAGLVKRVKRQHALYSMPAEQRQQILSEQEHMAMWQADRVWE